MKFVLLLCSLLLALPTMAQVCDRSQPDPVPMSRYRLQGALVLDTKTGLTWRRCSEGQAWNGKACRGKAKTVKVSQADAVVRALNSGPASERNGVSDWRLPTQDELLTLVHSHCSAPAINLKVFPDTLSDAYWTASSPGGTGQWAVNFSDGFDEIFNANRSLALRLVRK